MQDHLSSKFRRNLQLGRRNVFSIFSIISRNFTYVPYPSGFLPIYQFCVIFFILGRSPPSFDPRIEVVMYFRKLSYFSAPVISLFVMICLCFHRVIILFRYFAQFSSRSRDHDSQSAYAIAQLADTCSTLCAFRHVTSICAPAFAIIC